MSIKLSELMKEVDSWILTDEDVFPLICMMLGRYPRVKNKKKARHKGFRFYYKDRM